MSRRLVAIVVAGALLLVGYRTLGPDSAVWLPRCPEGAQPFEYGQPPDGVLRCIGGASRSLYDNRIVDVICPSGFHWDGRRDDDDVVCVRP